LREKRVQFVVLYLVCLSLVISLNAMALLWRGGWVWTAGLMTGVAVTFVVVARDTPPGFVENWQQGAWGEEFTAKVLTPLERHGWKLLHDLPDGRGNWDHIAVGPGGIFVLDSKKRQGKVTVDSHGVIYRNPFDESLLYDDTKKVAALKGQAARVNERIRRRCGQRAWVEPVMVLWADFPQRRVTINGVHFLHGSELAAWLTEQRPRRTPDVETITSALATTTHRA
jgi:hypothetical protein